MKKLMAMVAAAGCALAATAGEIAVAGHGTVKRPPDEMRLRFEVSACDKDQSAAKRLFAERTAAMAQTLAALGVASNEVVTAGMDMGRRFDYNNGTKTFAGYEFSEDYTFAAPLDRARLNRLYSALIDCRAAQQLRVDFALSDPEPAQREARQLAVRNARAVAEDLAAAAGVKLGAVDEILYRREEAGDFGVAPMMRMKAAGFGGQSAEDVVSVRDIEISDTVHIKWKVK